MSNTYYIRTRAGEFYALDATTEIVVTSPGTLTEHVVESGATVSDHYIVSNKSATLKGIITDIKSSGMADDRNKTTYEFKEGLERLQARREPFTVYWRNDNLPGEDEAGKSFKLDNCFFANIVFGQNKTHGSAYGSHAYEVELEMRQVRFANRANVTVERGLEVIDGIQKKVTATQAPIETKVEKPKEERSLGSLIYSRTGPGFIHNAVKAEIERREWLKANPNYNK